MRTWEIGRLSFIEPDSGDEVFIMVRATDEQVGILITARHSGHVEVYLASEERRRLIEALEEAVSGIKDERANTEREVSSIRSTYAGSNLQSVVAVGIRGDYLTLCLSLEGVEYEEEEVEVCLTPETCNDLAHILRQVA